MPELPEVETCRAILHEKIKNKIITQVHVFYQKVVHEVSVSHFCQQLIGQTIIQVDRLGKHLIFKMTNAILLSHLRMEGKFFYYDVLPHVVKNDSFYWKHVLVSFVFTDKSVLHYVDTRRFGTMHLRTEANYLITKPLNQIGIELNQSDVDPCHLQLKWMKKRIAIKSALLEQSIISGVGNIYANEILFATRIHPLTKTCNLTLPQIKNIIYYGKMILDQAIQEGGTTVSTFKSPYGIAGNFNQFLKVHGRIGKKCDQCQSFISKIKINQRGTYFCSVCQK